jgi:hypothetical protein
MTTTRTSVNEPGEELITHIAMPDRFDRLAAFRVETGLSAEQIVISRLVSTPMPFYPAVWENGVRWPGVEPTALWHPLFWLGEISERYVSLDPADTSLEVTESDDAWALRVAFECAARGVYDPETGEWLDMLVDAGIDVRDPAQLSRLVHWTLGDADEELDELSLPPLPASTVHADIDWAWHSASASVHPLTLVQVARDAQEIATGLVEVLDGWAMGGDEAVYTPAAITNLLFCGSVAFAPLGAEEVEWWESLHTWGRIKLLTHGDVGAADVAARAAIDEALNEEWVPLALERAEQIASVYLAEVEAITQAA